MKRFQLFAILVACLFVVGGTPAVEKSDCPKHHHPIASCAIKIGLPDIQQPDEYSCGTAALMSILAYYGLEPEDYDKLKKKLGANERAGTDYKRMLRFARRQGLQTEEHKDMKLDELIGFLDEGKPVICSIQAYDPVHTGAKRDKIYREENENGHFVVAIGYDEDCIFFMDPSLTGRRGFLPKAEFEERWHDNEGTDEEPNVIQRLGLVIWKKDGKDMYNRCARRID